VIQIRKSHDRGHFDHGWLDTYHTFSFGEYHDARWMGFSVLRVINEDVVAAGMGFPEHPHRDMEIITYVIAGQLAHKDSTGGAGVIGPGKIQHMTAGRGVRHSEFNPSQTEPVHLLQIWILPRERGLPPAYHEREFPKSDRRNQLRLLASSDGSNGSVPIQQDARMFASLLEMGKAVSHAFGSGRSGWIQLIRGELDVGGTVLEAGDGGAIVDEVATTIRARDDAEFLLFDLPE
jgi:redox-sensitive bicupin YhaK (pirin superfamily)